QTCALPILSERRISISASQGGKTWSSPMLACISEIANSKKKNQYRHDNSPGPAKMPPSLFGTSLSLKIYSHRQTRLLWCRRETRRRTAFPVSCAPQFLHLLANPVASFHEPKLNSQVTWR